MLCAATEEGFANGIVAVLDDPARAGALGVAARARVARDYSRDAFRRKLLAAYDSLGSAVRTSVATSM